MACSNPFLINENFLKHKTSRRKRINFAPNFTLQALGSSNFEKKCFSVPCGWCLNCRVDKQNELADRCEYEYITYGCGAFVTFTFDDAHIQPYTFIDSKTGQMVSTLSKKCAKDFLNRLNKEVHAYNKKYGLTPFCRPDYKYLIVGEYGENGKVFDRCHYHCLFFGLDFAMCERLFWHAWQFQGSIQVGAIRNGGINYVISYLDKQLHGYQAFLKYDYHNLERPFQSHSIGLGEGLYKSQLKYIREHDGNYRFHGKDKPVPIYYKNKLNIISDLQAESYAKRFQKRKNRMLELYDVKLKTYLDLERFGLEKAKIRQKQLEIKMVQAGKKIFKQSFVDKEVDNIINDKHRLPTLFDKQILKLITPNGNYKFKIDTRIKSPKDLKVRDMMKLHIPSMNWLYNKMVSDYGLKNANQAFGLGDVPF